ncbi:MAG TPA: hypothetical protein VGE59_04615 [Patescibacteria group bacterium]
MTRPPGYVALLTVIMVTVILTLIGVTAAFRSLGSRQTELVGSFKQQSKYAAEGCLDQALLNLSLNNTYAGNETITYPESGTTCKIEPIYLVTSQKILKASSQVREASTYLVLTVDAVTLERISLQEVRGF